MRTPWGRACNRSTQNCARARSAAWGSILPRVMALFRKQGIDDPIDDPGLVSRRHLQQWPVERGAQVSLLVDVDGGIGKAREQAVRLPRQLVRAERGVLQSAV